MPDAVIPTGSDCACGHPLIWWDGIAVCSVYRTHQTVAVDDVTSRPVAPIVAAVMAAEDEDRERGRAVPRRHLRAIRSA